MKNCLTRKNEKMCDPISSNSTENATPSSGTSPLASYKEVYPFHGQKLTTVASQVLNITNILNILVFHLQSLYLHENLMTRDKRNSSIILYYVIWWLQRQETTESLRNFNVKILVKWKSTWRSISCSKTAQFTPILDLPNCKHINWPLKIIPL